MYSIMSMVVSTPMSDVISISSNSSRKLSILFFVLKITPSIWSVRFFLVLINPSFSLAKNFYFPYSLFPPLSLGAFISYPHYPYIASANFSDTNFVTPFSSIVAPYKVSAYSMVPFLWVMTINCVSFENSFKY